MGSYIPLYMHTAHGAWFLLRAFCMFLHCVQCAVCCELHIHCNARGPSVLVACCCGAARSACCRFCARAGHSKFAGLLSALSRFLCFVVSFFELQLPSIPHLVDQAVVDHQPALLHTVCSFPSTDGFLCCPLRIMSLCKVEPRLNPYRRPPSASDSTMNYSHSHLVFVFGATCDHH
jgi:hypothetical protein